MQPWDAALTFGFVLTRNTWGLRRISDVPGWGACTMISSIAELDWMEEAVAAMAAAGTWLEPEPAVFAGLMADDADEPQPDPADC